MFLADGEAASLDVANTHVLQTHAVLLFLLLCGMTTCDMEYGTWDCADLVVFVPGEAVRTEDKPILPRGALDQGHRYAQPALPDQLVSSCSCCPSSLFLPSSTVKSNEVWMVGIHVRQFDLNHQLQLPREREERERGERERGERERGERERRERERRERERRGRLQYI